MKIKSRVDLVGLMKHLDLPLIAAEVGVAEGRLSEEFLKWGIQKLYLIDIWERIPFIKGCASFEQSWHDDNYKSVLERIKGREDDVIILKGFSYKMADLIPDNSLGLVYIDGDHTYEGSRADIDSYWPKLVNGGIMAFHDAVNEAYGIQNAVHDFTKGQGINILEEDGKIENIGCYIIKQ